MFPLELWMKICDIACDDDGHTGRSLSLVSRRFRDVSFLIRFETITLKGMSRMRLFLEMLEDAPSKPTVKHLLLSDNGRDEKPESGVTPVAVCTSVISSVAPTLISLAGDLRKWSVLVL